MKIGPPRTAPPISLAPLDEQTNLSFRLLMKPFGAGLACPERE
jgi:hypothetical protein